MKLFNKYQFKKVSYVRDIPSYETIDGKHIKDHTLFRTSYLYKINDKIFNRIKKIINPKLIIDLRTIEEATTYPDKVDNTVPYYNLPVLTDFDNPVINRQNRLGHLQKIMKNGGTKKHLSNSYRTLASSDLALQNYHNFIKNLIDTDGNVVYHCTQGKDRTGVATMIILSILGVDQETIIKDYLKYNRSQRFKNFWIFLGVTCILFRFKSACQLNNLLTAQKVYAKAFFDEVEEKFGTFENYITDGLKLNQNDILALKNKYLV